MEPPFRLGGIIVNMGGTDKTGKAGKKGAKAAETGGWVARLRLGLALYMHLRDTENSYRYSTGS